MKIVFQAVLLLLLTSAIAEPWHSNCPCGRIYDPRCGSDGRTYSNDCEFKCRLKYLQERKRDGIRVVKHGRCEEWGAM